MTVEEIFKGLIAHQLKGVMIHEEFADYYAFLGLNGYKRCHEYHFMRELCAYRKLCKYYISHYNRLLPHVEIENPEVIPDNWHNYTREDVEPSTKKNAVKSGLVKWVEWERETKKLYEKAYKELLELGEIATTCIVKEIIVDVDCELKKAEGYLLNKYTLGFDLSDIISEQKPKHDSYKRKILKEFKGAEC